jgi:hypothetical protein
MGQESGMNLLTTCILRKDVVQEYLEKKYLLALNSSRMRGWR